MRKYEAVRDYGKTETASVYDRLVTFILELMAKLLRYIKDWVCHSL